MHTANRQANRSSGLERHDNPIAFWAGIFLLGVCFGLPAMGVDWPQWRGPERNGISRETGWQSHWSAGGPRQLWKAKVGVGLSTVSVSQGRLYTMGNTGDQDTVYCLDAATGHALWTHTYACSAKDSHGYHGPRCTPTVDGDRVYSLSRHGHLFCLNAKTGKVIWTVNFEEDFDAKTPQWGFSESPLVEQDQLIAVVGAKGASVVAFDKLSGRIHWQRGDDPAGYSSLIAFDQAGTRCLAVFCRDYFVGRRASDGTELWRYPWKTSYGVNAATPIVHGDQVFVSSGYGFGCALLHPSAAGVHEVWRNKNMRNHVNSCVLWQGYLYGYDEGQLKCLEVKTGAEQWRTGRYGKGSLMLADQKLILYSDRGKLGIAEATPKAFREISSAQVLGGKSTWAAPVLANGRIYCRSKEDLVALDVTPH